MYILCQFVSFGAEINLKQGMTFRSIGLVTESTLLDFLRIRKTDLNLSYLSTTIYSRNKLSRTIYSRNKFQLNQIS